ATLAVIAPGVAAPPIFTVTLRCEALSREPDFPQAGSARLSIRQEDRRTRARRLVIDMDGLGGGRRRGRDPRLDYFVVRLSTPPSFVLWTGRRRKTVTLRSDLGVWIETATSRSCERVHFGFPSAKPP